MNWVDIYRQRVTTADRAVADIRSGDRVWVHPGCNTPTRLIEAMVARAPELTNVEVAHILTLADAPYAASNAPRTARPTTPQSRR